MAIFLLLRFFQRGLTMVLVKKWLFCHLVFLGYLVQENLFWDILERKSASLGYKNKKSKCWDFPKEVYPWFWFKNGHFSNSFRLGNIGQENVFYDILERKRAFLGYKIKKFKKLKNWDFFEGINPWLF